jgi:hypothetical protein
MTQLAALLQNIFRYQSQPTIYYYIDKVVTALPGGAIWNIALHRRHELRLIGIRKGDLVISRFNRIDLLIDLVASVIGEFIFLPYDSRWFLELKEKKSYSKNESRKIWNLETKIPLKSPVPLSLSEVVSEETVLIVKSSKNIGFSGGFIKNQLELHYKILNLKHDDTRLNIVPLNNTFGLILDLLLGCFARQTIFLGENRFCINKIISKIKTEDPTHLALIPQMLEIIVHKMKSEKLSFPHLIVHLGGTDVNSELLREANCLFNKVHIARSLS